jgi:hypothetical protein
VPGLIGSLGSVFALDFVRQKITGPDLTVRVWIGAAHCCALVFKHLNPLPTLAKISRLLSPEIDHPPDAIDRHLREREVVTGGEAHHPAFTADRRGPKELVAGIITLLDILQKGSKVVLENKRVSVIVIADATGSFVAGTEITIRIVLRSRFRNSFGLSLPGAFGAMR